MRNSVINYFLWVVLSCFTFSLTAVADDITPVAEPVVEVVAEPMAEVVVEPVAEVVAEPVVEVVAEPVAPEPTEGPLQSKTIPLFSAEGTQLFLNAKVDKKSYIKLSSYFVTQKQQKFCSVASAVMVLNALGVKAPFDPVYAPHNIFTQDNFFTENAWRVVSRLQVEAMGMGFRQAAEAIAVHLVQITGAFAEDSSAEEFRSKAREALANDKQYVIVNYNRPCLEQQGGGHFAPLAAYSEEFDMFLILDVARYKFPPFWVKTSDLWAAMATIDSSTNETRGYLLVSNLLENMSF